MGIAHLGKDPIYSCQVFISTYHRDDCHHFGLLLVYLNWIFIRF